MITFEPRNIFERIWYSFFLVGAQKRPHDLNLNGFYLWGKTNVFPFPVLASPPCTTPAVPATTMASNRFRLEYRVDVGITINNLKKKYLRNK